MTNIFVALLMALKLTRKGIIFVSVFAFMLLIAGASFAAWYMLTDGGQVGTLPSDAGGYCCDSGRCGDGSTYGADANSPQPCSDRRNEACDGKGGTAGGGGSCEDTACGSVGQSCCSGSGCDSGLSCSGGKCEFPNSGGGDGKCGTCVGKCGDSGCQTTCDGIGPKECGIWTSRFMCNGRKRSGCNDANGESLSSTPDYSDPQFWCKTYQFDSNAPNGHYSVVYVGDGGEVCNEADNCNPDDLDWDCSVAANPPACDSLTVSPKVVTSLTQPITVAVKASDPDGTPSSIGLRAAAAHQSPPRAALGGPCTAAQSYYCQGPDVYALAGQSLNSNTLNLTTTYSELSNKIKALGVPLDLNDTGIYLTVNVSNDSDGNLCTSNVAYNSGNGALWNNGAWDTACNGGCNVNIAYEPPDVVTPPRCGDGNCDAGELCDTNKSCSDGSTVSCRDNCTYCGDAIVNGGEECDFNAPGETSETCSSACKRVVTVEEPYCGDGTCNQSHEQCEDNTSCIDSSTVSCRNNCTYCGDGILNGNEQCDDGNTVDDDECRNDCTLPYCGDGNLDEGEDCDDGNTVDDDECSNDCKIPAPPNWTIEKDGDPACVEGKDLSATVGYKITVTNTGQGKGDLDRVVDTLDQTVQDSWLDLASIDPSGTYLQRVITWQLGASDQTMQPDEKREFIYTLNVPSSGFGTLTNTAEGFPVTGSSFSVVNDEVVSCSTETPKTGVLDSSLGKVGLGLVLISLSGLYFYFESSDGVLMRFIFTDEKVAHKRDQFEDSIRDEDE